MNWTPITESELCEKIVQAEARMTPEQFRLWQEIKITPAKWQQSPWGEPGQGFWAVGVIGQQVIWFNDIEDGFNLSRYQIRGTIGEYWCNQDGLEAQIQTILAAIGPALR